MSTRPLLLWLALSLALIGAQVRAAPPADAKELVVGLFDDSQGEPEKMLQVYLHAQAKKHFDLRRQAVARLTTPEEVQNRQQELRQKFLDAIGALPPRTPLNPQVVGKIEEDDYRIEKVIYESRPQHHVTANLYLPKAAGPVPGVLVPCGHSVNGKAAESYQRVCILLAKNGIAALCFDPIGQGERNQLLGQQGHPPPVFTTSQHTVLGVPALLVGRNTASYFIWDCIRSLDYLASRPEVDAERLGCHGHSGGGTQTAYLMALDSRVQAAAPSGYITSLERLFATIGPQDAEQNITGQVAFGMEHADYLTMRAPKPTLVLCTTRDFFDIQGTWTTFREAKLLYGVMGHSERVAIGEFDFKHALSKPGRETAVRWMRRWLLKKDDAIVEGDFATHKESELLCSRTGQVLEDLKGKSVPVLNLERAEELAAERGKFLREKSAADVLAQVRQAIRCTLPVPAARVKDKGKVERANCTITKLAFETEPGVTVPALRFEPTRGLGGPLTLWLSGDGKAADAAPGGAIDKLVQAGQTVLALDLRGLGETAPACSEKLVKVWGTDWKEAFLSLHLDRPLLGQRVHDVLAIVNQLGDKQDVYLAASGVCGPVALHAAVLEPRIKQVTLEKSIVSWSQVVRTPLSYAQLPGAVPGVLAWYDLPDLAALIAPRPLTVKSAIDPGSETGKPVTQEYLEQAFARCREVYGKQQADKALVLQGDR